MPRFLAKLLPSIPAPERRALVGWLAFALALHLLTAWFSVGWHSADEHFQILEFANFKLGRTPPSVLAVEYAEQMRPWLQPAIYWAMAKAWLGFGVQNPALWAASFRAFASVLGWLSLVGMSLGSYLWFPGARERRIALLTASCLAFLPALHARPSSESLGGSALVLGICVFELARARGEHRGAWGWVAGLLLGFSFEMRFQVGIMVAGYLAWLLFRARMQWRAFGPILGGLAIAFLAGRAVDAWGYGEWVMSPWQYVRYNLVENKVNQYGRAPWWDVFRMSFTESWPFLGTALAAAIVLAWFRSPGSAFTWATVPFFLIHEAIAHKELRFFFPIVSAAPVLVALALRDPFPRLGRIGRACWAFLKLNNWIALAALAFVPFSRIAQFQQAVWEAVPEASRGRVGSFELWTSGKDPFEVLGTDTYFYRPSEVVVRTYRDPMEVERAAREHGPVWLFQSSMRWSGPPELERRCRIEFRTLPRWLTGLNAFGWVERANVWSLYRCD